MHQAGKADAWHMARAGEHPLDVPDGFLGRGKMLRQKAAAILFGEDAVEAPITAGQGADVEDVDDQEIAGLGALHTDRPAEKMHGAKVDVPDILGGLVVLDKSTGPIIGLEDEVVARFDRR